MRGNRYNCPRCGKSLRFRLLPHVPTRKGFIAFACIHCGAALTYNESRLDHRLWGTPWRRIATSLASMVLVSALHWAAGRTVALAALVLLVVAFLLPELLSSKPAYRIVDDSSLVTNTNRAASGGP